MSEKQMGTEVNSILSAVGTIAGLLRPLRARIKRSPGAKRSVLLELELNNHVMLLHVAGEIGIEEAVKKLETTNLKAALESDFAFSRIQRKKVSPGSVARLPGTSHYVGWTTEQLFRHLYLKIRELQHAVRSRKGGRKIRRKVRLRNILSLVTVIRRHIGG